MVETNKVLSIRELTKYIKSKLDNDPVLTEVWVRGEISNFTHHSSGHMYYTLKDESSRLRSIMFAGSNRFLKFIPKNGTKVIAKGYISVFERDGQYQFYVQEMQPDGIGQLYLAYEQLKHKLELEGLFNTEIKKELPLFPYTVGVITSPTGAAISDIITTIRRRYPLVKILIYPVLVQGIDAAKTIAHAIRQMNDHGEADLLIVGRGGGSIEELWAFNEEIVARSIYQSKLPVVSAVGHETDFTIADFVADVRAATPTAAAELAVPSAAELKTSIGYLVNRLERQLHKNLEHKKEKLSQVLKSIVFRRPKQHFLSETQRVDHLEKRLSHSLNNLTSNHKERLLGLQYRLLHKNPTQKVDSNKEKLNYLRKQLLREISVIKDHHQRNLDLKIGQLDALSPLKVMRRGYAIIYDEHEKELVKSVDKVQLGDMLKLHLHDGKLDITVWGLEGKK